MAAIELRNSDKDGSRWLDIVDQALQFFFMILAASCAIAAVAEIAARDSFFAFLNSETNRIRKEFVDRSRESERPAVASSSRSVAESMPQGGIVAQAASPNSIGRQQMLLEVQEFQELASRVRLLSELGAAYATHTLEALRNSYQEKRRSAELAVLQSRRDELAQYVGKLERDVRRIERDFPAESTLGSKPKEATVPQSSGRDSSSELRLTLERAKADKIRLDAEFIAMSAREPYTVTERILRPTTLSSDYLLAIAIMACGVMGALVAGMRGRDRTSIRDFSLGLSSGFICYLGIKGGKYIFLLHATGEAVGFNPYGSAFAGLLVGLFSQKAYETLELLFSDLTSRIRQAVEKGNEKAAPGASAPAPERPGAPEGGRPPVEVVK